MTDIQKTTLACIRACCDSIKAQDAEITEYQDEWLNDVYDSLLHLQKEIVWGISPAGEQERIPRTRKQPPTGEEGTC